MKKPPILVVIKYHKLKFKMSNDKLYNIMNSGNKHAKYAFLLISVNILLSDAMFNLPSCT